MKSRITFCVCLFLIMSANLFAQDIPKELLGNWSYELTHPMTGETNQGVCVIKKVKKDVKAFFEGGQTSMETSALRANPNSKFYADLTAESYPLTVSFELDGDKINCVFDAGVMQIPVAMSRAKK